MQIKTQHSTELNKLWEENEELKKENTDLESAVSENREKIIALETSITVSDDKLKQYKGEIENLRAEIDNEGK